ncbi:quinolinate synthase NadA [Salicibibacter halophilus]|uniref:Quinolinate synthase n=1 Tax=Salicibibacter halophilus TaxID=2502791 RepID=A0A514LJX8_9BACI|nr:quinolinate synthase NadA [Salicibibacter halophilus]QDI92132.1 quinolinate synthase NadA [Salicibibacter halophilus]
MSLLDAIKKETMPGYYQKMDDQTLEVRAREAREKLGERLFIPGHHYQRDEIIAFADASGDSLQLAQQSAATTADYIVFCGVHFMAETADILTTDEQKVILPDMRAGCSMADMADIRQTERAWEKLTEQFGDTILPLTYVNSTAAIKAFCGRHGGATVTSSNASEMIEEALERKERLLFLPDQHLGRNTAYDLGIPLEQMIVWDPIRETFEGEVHDDIKVILWKGHCSVHEKFTVDYMEKLRGEYEDLQVIVHPECSWEVVQAADRDGSTKKIIDTIASAPSGTTWAIGTEMNLVQRLANTHTDKMIMSLNPNMCPCLTMNRIDLAHFTWCLEELVEGRVVNEISVDESTAIEARTALDRMLSTFAI